MHVFLKTFDLFFDYLFIQVNRWQINLYQKHLKIGNIRLIFLKKTKEKSPKFTLRTLCTSLCFYSNQGIPSHEYFFCQIGICLNIQRYYGKSTLIAFIERFKEINKQLPFISISFATGN